MSSTGSRSPDVPLTSSLASSSAPNIPLTLPRWGGPPPPPLPHHPHSNSNSSGGSGSASASAGIGTGGVGASTSGTTWNQGYVKDNYPRTTNGHGSSHGHNHGSGSISLAKISNPISVSPTLGLATTTSDFYRRDSDEYNSALGLNKFRDQDFAIPSTSSASASGSRIRHERDTSESPSIGTVGNGKRRRRDSEVPKLEEMDDRPLAITCAPCRSRKIKCDSKKPSCENCSKTPHECYYPVKLKPGLRPGAGMDVMRRVEVLEERMQGYESRLMEQEARLSQMYQTNLNQLNSGSTQGQFIQTPSSAIPFPGTVAGAGAGQGLGQGQGSGFDLPPEFNPLSLAQSGPSASPSGLSTASFRDPQVLPPDDIVRDLIGLFFAHIHPWAPILSPTMPVYSQPWSIVVHAIVVVTLRLSTDPRLMNTKQAYRAAAKQHILAHAIESTSIDSVQALALLALDLIGSEQGPSSWGILALLTRSAVHLGLASEEDTSSIYMAGRAPTPSLSRTSIIPSATTWHEDELRRRLFWLIFCLDRYACVSTGWDFALPDFDIKRRLPASDELWMKPEWFQAPVFKPVLHREWTPDPSVLSPLAFLVEALDLLGRSHTLQSQVIEPGDARAVEVRKDMSMTLTSASKRWFNDLPLKDGSDSMSLMIQAIHHATLLKLNAYYAFPALSNGEPQEPYTSTCLNATRAMVDLTSRARDVGFQNTSSPLFIWSSWVAARVLFVYSFLSHRTQPDDDFDIIVAALKEQAQYWTLANQYAKLLERAKRKWLHSSTDSNPNLPEAIHVLLDLRRTAYSAVGVNSEATPHVSPPDMNLNHLPAWAVQPLLGDLHDWFDLPAGLFQADV